MSQLTVVSPYLLMSSVATPMPRWLFSTPIMRILEMKNYHHVMCHVACVMSRVMSRFMCHVTCHVLCELCHV